MLATKQLLVAIDFHSILFRSAPIRIFEADHRSQKAVSADPITDAGLFKAFFFYHVELFIVILQSGFLDIYSGPPPLRWLLWGGGFYNLKGWKPLFSNI